MNIKNAKWLSVGAISIFMMMLFLMGSPFQVKVNNTKINKETLENEDNSWTSLEIQKKPINLNFTNYEHLVDLPVLNDGEDHFFSINPAGSKVSTKLISSLFEIYRDSNSRLSSKKINNHSRIESDFSKKTSNKFGSIFKKILTSAGIKVDKTDRAVYVSTSGYLSVKLQNGKFKKIALINKDFHQNFRSYMKANFFEPLSVSLDPELPGKAVINPEAISIFEQVDFYAGVINKNSSSSSPKVFLPVRFNLRA